jgi:outer membrane protein OmpA-like peptidoglycan-associated protein
VKKAAKKPADLDESMKELDERERYALKKLRASMGSASITAEGVGEVLPDAVVFSADEGAKLPKSMVQTTEKAISLSVAEDPVVLSDALFPIIGSAIRKAVERLVSEILFKINAGLEKGLSVKRLGWRFESLRSGIPFYEIALKHTLDYRVEHVFLIHKKTGLLIADASLPGPSSLADKDMVASMLTAVRDYIKDSLSLAKTETVNVLSAGDYSIFVEEGPLALIALVVRGTADPSVRSLAQDALETVHTRLGPQLRAFDGEIEPFEKAAPFLESCLVSVDRGAKGKKPVYAIALLCILGATACFFIARGAMQSVRDGAFLSALDSEKGIVVVRAHRSRGLLRGTIMRTPEARPIAAIAAEKGFDMAQTALDVETYLSLGSSSETAVSPNALSQAPAPDATAPNALHTPAAGNAAVDAASRPADSLPAPLAAAPRAIAPSTASPSATAPAATAPKIAQGDSQLRALVSRLEAERILFAANSARPLPGQERRIRNLGNLSFAIVSKARELSLEAKIETVGHAAGKTSDAAGDGISVARARAAAALVSGSEGRVAPFIVFRGVGNAEPLSPESSPDGAAQNRSASFTATFR